MTAIIRPLPDAASGFAIARMVLDDPRISDPEQIEAACVVLDCSEWYYDVIRRRRARERLAAQALATMSDRAARMAQHFEALETPEDVRRRKRMRIFGAIVLAMLIAGTVAIAIRAEAKSARTVALYHQVEEGR